MTSKKATVDSLADLHRLLAEKLIEELKKDDPSPQLMAQVIKFLKDNGIECDINSGADDGQLSELLKLAEGVPAEEPEAYRFDGMNGKLLG